MSNNGWSRPEELRHKMASAEEIGRESIIQRKILRTRILEYQHLLRDNAEQLSKEERASIKQKISSYSSSYRDVKEQAVLAGIAAPISNSVTYRNKFRSQHGELHSKFGFDVPFSARATRNILGRQMDDISDKDWSYGHREEDDLLNIEEEPRAEVNTYSQWTSILYKCLTQRQLFYLHVYYNLGYSMEQIGRAGGVNKSTVSRTISRGLNRMKKYIHDIQLAQKCDVSPSMFDVVRFIYECTLMTERQKLYLLVRMSYAKPSMEDMAATFGVNKSTISRTLTRAMRILVFLEMDQKYPAYRPSITWDDSTTPESLHAELGL